MRPFKALFRFTIEAGWVGFMKKCNTTFSSRYNIVKKYQLLGLVILITYPEP